MDFNPTKSNLRSSSVTSKSSCSSLGSSIDDTPKKKKIDRMVYSIEKSSFQWAKSKQTIQQPASNFQSSSKFQDYFCDSLSDDSQTFNEFMSKTLKKTTELKLKKRKVLKQPFKEGQVNNWKDNFYTNLLDWNNDNIIFAASDYEILQFTLSSFDTKETKAHIWPWIKEARINSIKCSPTNKHTAVGYDNGAVQIYDYCKGKCLIFDSSHQARVTALDWTQRTILTGSKDKTIKIYDQRTLKPCLSVKQVHEQQVLGVKRSINLICSGGNDNLVAIYDIRKAKQGIFDTFKHQAAVKSLAWIIPDSTLISGGGTSDKMIKFWEKKQMKITKRIETGSQVCNLVVSKNSREFISCQGFSQNQIVLWDIEGNQTEIIHGKHSSRVLYSCLSPCGQFLATGAGDKKLLIWRMFPSESRRNSLIDRKDLR